MWVTGVQTCALPISKKFQAADESKLAAAKNGTAKREWVEKTLAAKEFEIIDDVYEP